MVAFFSTCGCCGHQFPAEPEVATASDMPLGVPAFCSPRANWAWFVVRCPFCGLLYWWLPSAIASPEGWYAERPRIRLEIWPRVCDGLPDCVLSGEPI